MSQCGTKRQETKEAKKASLRILFYLRSTLILNMIIFRKKDLLYYYQLIIYLHLL